MTGMALVSYTLRVVKDVVNRSPRFRRSLGDVGPIYNNRISYGNVQVIVRDVTTDSARQSFDYFICTQTGRAILAKVADKEGQFIEYIVETDASRATPAAGVYYLNVDSVDEGSQSVGLTMETHKWYEGRVNVATGTRISFAPGIDATTVTVTDPTSQTSVAYQAAIGYIYLLSTVGGILIKDSHGNTLTPLTDYWVEGTQTQELLSPTVFGTQTATIPANYLSWTLVDQDGFELRLGKEYITLASNQVELSAWTPAGETISITGTVKLDPSNAANLLAPENILPITLAPGETIDMDQVFVSTQEGDNVSVVTLPNGDIVLPAPLPPGGWCRYEVRVLAGQTTVAAKKNAVNKNILPGLRVAIGDQVEVGDQCAILVSPKVTETYRVYGGKPAVSFTLEVKANDPTTADELAKILASELLYRRSENLNADGLSLSDASMSMTQGTRDDSGTAPTYSTLISFSGMADWRIFEPLVTRVRSIDVTTQPYIDRPVPAPRYHCLQASGFIPDYR